LKTTAQAKKMLEAREFTQGMVWCMGHLQCPELGETPDSVMELKC
jgi:hypothetical protein